MSLRPHSAAYDKTAAEAWRIARDYDRRGLSALAKTWEATAKRLDAKERKERLL